MTPQALNEHMDATHELRNGEISVVPAELLCIGCGRPLTISKVGSEWVLGHFDDVKCVLYHGEDLSEVMELYLAERQSVAMPRVSELESTQWKALRWLRGGGLRSVE